ncbi:MAG: tetratricopeptide repeat protein [Planctomycetota bacterium]
MAKQNWGKTGITGLTASAAFVLLTLLKPAAALGAPTPQSGPAGNPSLQFGDENASALSGNAASPTGGGNQNPNQNSTVVSEDLLAIRGGPVLENLEEGDRLLLGGNYNGAMRYFSDLYLQGEKGVEIHLRLGLASELTGNLSRGWENYREAVRYAEPESMAQLWSLLGVARVWMKQGKHDLANSLLSEMLLKYGNDNYPPIIRSTAALLLAESIRVEDRRPTPSDTFNWPVYFRTAPNPDQQLSETTTYQPNVEIDSPNPTAEITLVQKPGLVAAGIVVNANVNSKLITELIRELASTTGLNFQLSEKARARLSGRKTSLKNRIISTADWLDHLLFPHRLIWEQEGANIYITIRDEVTVDQRHEYFTSRRARLLRDVQINADNKFQRCIAFMHDGNDLMLSGELEAALGKYEAARKMVPSGELSSLLFLNTALLLQKQNSYEESLENYYNALDQSLEPDVKSRCYLGVARLELAGGRIDKAVVAASRGLRFGDERSRQGQNLLVLVKAYLLQDKPYAANQALFENSYLLRGTSDEPMGSVFASYSRLAITGRRAGLGDEANRLVNSLVAVADDGASDYADDILLSRAYREVGLISRAVDYMEEAHQRVESSFWHDLVLLELARLYKDLGNLEKADSKLSEMNDLNSYREALLLQAELDLALERTDNCISICRRIIKYELSEAETKSTLSLLGKAYQKQGNHFAAATCFSGVVPDAKSIQ